MYKIDGYGICPLIALKFQSRIRYVRKCMISPYQRFLKNEFCSFLATFAIAEAQRLVKLGILSGNIECWGLLL